MHHLEYITVIKICPYSDCLGALYTRLYYVRRIGTNEILYKRLLD